LPRKVGRQLTKSIIIMVCPAVYDSHILALDKTPYLQAFAIPFSDVDLGQPTW